MQSAEDHACPPRGGARRAGGCPRTGQAGFASLAPHVARTATTRSTHSPLAQGRSERYNWMRISARDVWDERTHAAAAELSQRIDAQRLRCLARVGIAAHSEGAVGVCGRHAASGNIWAQAPTSVGLTSEVCKRDLI